MLRIARTAISRRAASAGIARRQAAPIAAAGFRLRSKRADTREILYCGFCLLADPRSAQRRKQESRRAQPPPPGRPDRGTDSGSIGRDGVKESRNFTHARARASERRNASPRRSAGHAGRGSILIAASATPAARAMVAPPACPQACYNRHNAPRPMWCGAPERGTAGYRVEAVPLGPLVPAREGAGCVTPWRRVRGGMLVPTPTAPRPVRLASVERSRRAVTRNPLRRWNWAIARLVIGPSMPSIRP